VMRRLNEFGVNGGTQTRVFNIREAEKLKTLISNNIENPRTPSGAALTRLRQSVDDAVNSLADGGVGAEAAGAFQGARRAASQRFGAIDRAPALENALSPEPVPPAQFVEKFIVRGDIQAVANNMRQMAPEARAEARAAVIDWIRSKALNGQGETALVSQAGLNKALMAIGPRKLDLIFAGDREALDQLQRLARVTALAKNAPPSAGVNYSSSATTVLDALEKSTRIPIIGPLLGKPGDWFGKWGQVSTAMTPVPVQPAPPMIDPRLLAAGGVTGGRMATPLGALLGPTQFKP
jgi:hypothetical protein